MRTVSLLFAVFLLVQDHGTPAAHPCHDYNLPQEAKTCACHPTCHEGQIVEDKACKTYCQPHSCACSTTPECH